MKITMHLGEIQILFSEYISHFKDQRLDNALRQSLYKHLPEFIVLRFNGELHNQTSFPDFVEKVKAEAEKLRKEQEEISNGF